MLLMRFKFVAHLFYETSSNMNCTLINFINRSKKRGDDRYKTLSLNYFRFKFILERHSTISLSHSLSRELKVNHISG